MGFVQVFDLWRQATSLVRRPTVLGNRIPFLYNQRTSIIIVCMNTVGLKKALWRRLIHDPISLCLAVPEIEVVDDRDKKTAEKYYKGGSTIELKCIVRQIVGEPPEYILWHHEDRMLNYDTERGGIRYTIIISKKFFTFPVVRNWKCIEQWTVKVILCNWAPSPFHLLKSGDSLEKALGFLKLLSDFRT